MGKWFSDLFERWTRRSDYWLSCPNSACPTFGLRASPQMVAKSRGMEGSELLTCEYCNQKYRFVIWVATGTNIKLEDLNKKNQEALDRHNSRQP
jgi:hypothetical protein